MVKDLGTLSACIQFPDSKLDTVAQGPGDVDLECRRSPPPSASQPSILLEQASPATDPLSVRKPEVGKASIRQGNHPYYQVAGKPPIRQPPQPTHQSPIIQMRKPVRSNLSKMKKPHLQRQKPLFSSLAFSSSPPPSSWPNTNLRRGTEGLQTVSTPLGPTASPRDPPRFC